MMTDPPKYKTFRDLKTLQKGESSDSLSRNSHPTSTTSIASSTQNLRARRSNESRPTNESRTAFQQKEVSRSSKFSESDISRANSTTALISPARDFQKIPNSVIRNAIPDRLFRGKSKQVWDFLWSLSRGSINPSRTVRVPRTEIKDKAGLGSMVTVDAAIEHLRCVGLITVRKISVGSSKGNEYEIFSPDEITNASYTSTTGITSPAHNLDELVIPESSITRTTQLVENTIVYKDANTSLNTFLNDDDSVLDGFAEVLEKASQRITGKSLQKQDKNKWTKIAELLVFELEIASHKTDAISSVPGFLFEHLRRRLRRGDFDPDEKIESRQSNDSRDSQKRKLSRKQATQLGASEDVLVEDERYTPESLSKEQRDAVLASMRHFKNHGSTDFVDSVRETYTTSDWEWLMKKLETND